MPAKLIGPVTLTAIAAIATAARIATVRTVRTGTPSERATSSPVASKSNGRAKNIASTRTPTTAASAIAGPPSG